MKRTKTALVPTEVTVNDSDAMNPEISDERALVIQGMHFMLEQQKRSDARANHVLDKMVESYRDLVLQVKVLGDLQSSLIQQALDNKKLQEDLLDRRDDRKLKREESKQHLQMIEELGGEALSLLPLVAKKFLGAPVLTEAETGLLRAFFANLTRKEMEGMLDALSPAKQAEVHAMIAAMPLKPRDPMNVPEPEIAPEQPHRKPKNGKVDVAKNGKTDAPV